ncbi:hypothetical protein [Lysinibacillus sp. G4S2]|uniref:hypothetical protein n=1 Tax=Lysinibacillus sp. G4S2 TaxID=3055859 RepID=UPI0025A073BD|nr:hypothetical protein [Lysinibacillus sp. G4S2]MDM5246743.1 hypothetical protein [Lysinibacillus sp. G4S2]
MQNSSGQLPISIRHFAYSIHRFALSVDSPALFAAPKGLSVGSPVLPGRSYF